MKKISIRFVTLLALALVASGCEATEATAVSADYHIGHFGGYVVFLILSMIVPIGALFWEGDHEETLEMGIEGLLMIVLGLILMAAAWDECVPALFAIIPGNIVLGFIMIVMAIKNENQDGKIVTILSVWGATLFIHLFGLGIMFALLLMGMFGGLAIVIGVAISFLFGGDD